MLRAHSPWRLRGVTPLDFPCGLLGTQAEGGYICLLHNGWVVDMWTETHLLQTESEKQLYGLST